jgi:hypothetical protein
MAKRSSYERRGNATTRTVREKASANKPITRREMRAAFEAWQAGRGQGQASQFRDSVAGMTRTPRDKRSKDNDKGRGKDSV